MTADWPSGDDVIRLPTGLLSTAGKASDDNDLSILLTRMRTAGTNSVRADEERSMARIWDLPTARKFSISGKVRLSQAAADNVIDQAVGIPDETEGGVKATSTRRIPGGIKSTASAAIDDDPSTWWMPGFLDQRGDGVTYEVGRAADGRLDGRHHHQRRAPLGASTPPPRGRRQGRRGHRPAGHPGGQGRRAQRHQHVQGDASRRTPARSSPIAVDEPRRSLRDVLTTDWYSGTKVVMPIGIVELGIPGLSVDRPTGPISDACRTRPRHRQRQAACR